MYLKGQGDKQATEELLKRINKHCRLSTDEYTRLSSYVEDGDHIFNEPPNPTPAASTEKGNARKCNGI
ncbi:hypothetical protein M5689_012271 [Euphorbia peplus]|nr:hypothetical protein M5689_012271 [Euphorbia peplus]